MKFYEYKNQFGVSVPTGNRYAQIHLLFRVLAKEKLGPNVEKSNVNEVAKKVKDFWKSFYSVDSLTQLSDSDLSMLSEKIKHRITTVKKLKS